MARTPKPVKRGKDLTRQERIDYIVRLMESGVFRRGRTYRLLAKEWGLAERTVMDDTAVASHIVRRQILDPDGCAVDVGVVLTDMLWDAKQEAQDASLKGTREGLKARDQAIAAAKVLADISGASAPQRHEIQTTEATPERARQLMSEAFGKVAKKSD